MDLSKIRHNTRMVARGLNRRGIAVTGVTKAVCGHPAIARAMLDGGAEGLADARLSNVERLRKAGVTCPITLIRTPMLSQADRVVHFCDASYNTEIAVIAALAAAAIRKGTVHGIILMVEMGDQREGVLPENLGTCAQQVVKMPGVALKGIGANFACFSGLAPNGSQMLALSNIATDIEGQCGPVFQTVSGGNSANLPWALSAQSTGRIDDLRLGEAILLGVDPLSGDRIGEMHTDAFTLVAEVIETGKKPAATPVAFVNPTLAKLHIVSRADEIKRLILAIGRQDTDISGLSMPDGSILMGATSDHLVIETNHPTLRLGSEMRFQMNYTALMHAMAAPDIATKLLDDRSSRSSPPPQGKAEHLTLV
ncbi:alanine racemase [Aliisedimentitalea sp. MJ-SS2]|uniref:alanine racemase n=1 Tax=Aliisedimentitalea sp. MJ-SS2 TaxID=3049795 RepID=UPI00292EE22B|nr:alanine racemase [Alisedimentitalea sp. MJ-SS2]